MNTQFQPGQLVKFAGGRCTESERSSRSGRQVDWRPDRQVHDLNNQLTALFITVSQFS